MQYEYILISSFNFNSLPFSFTKIKDLIYFFRRGKLSYTSLSLDSLSKTFHFCSLEFYIRIDSRTINSGHQNKKFCLKTDGARLEVRPILARKVNCKGRFKEENMWNFPQRGWLKKNPHFFLLKFFLLKLFPQATREGRLQIPANRKWKWFLLNNEENRKKQRELRDVKLIISFVSS